jgi:hypothetical protein
VILLKSKLISKSSWLHFHQSTEETTVLYKGGKLISLKSDVNKEKPEDILNLLDLPKTGLEAVNY